MQSVEYGLENDKLSPSLQKKHMIMDNILNYISNVDSDPVLRLYNSEQLREAVIEQYHDDNGHLALDKTHDAIKIKYYWHNLYKQLYTYT